jgi:HD-like signal output (HDOD) protein
MRKRILFVDGEPCILDVLRYMLKNMLPEWDTAFANSSQEALDLMASESFDVIVSDGRVQGMDGEELFNKVKKDFPHTVRLGFSSEYDREMMSWQINSTHQFLLKPNDLSQIRNTIARAFSLKEILSAEDLKTLISQIKTLPSLPEMYHQIVAELQSSYPSVERVGSIISQDMAMTAKLLQIVNSAFFGLRQHISNPTQAASLLGLDILKSLVLVMHIFSEQNGLAVEKFSIKTLWTHSLSVAIMSREIVLMQDVEKKIADDAFIAGLLHDLGKLVLMANMGQPYSRALAMAQEKCLPVMEMEKQELGAGHTEVGAYLLGLWCFSDSLIQTCAFHHEPSRCRDQSFGPLTAVHVANLLDHEAHPGAIRGAPSRLDMEYLNRLGLAERIPVWRAHNKI